MTQQPLPTFENHDVAGLALQLSGKAGPGRAYAIGERVALVVQVRIADIEFKSDDAGVLTRLHKGKVTECYEVPFSVLRDAELADDRGQSRFDLDDR